MAKEDCPVCGGKTTSYVQGTVEMTVYYSPDVLYRIAIGERDRLDVRTCVKCGHGFVPITVSQEAINSWYTRAPTDTTFLSEADARRKTARVVLRRLQRLLPDKGSLLDVGCGPGLFVDEASRSGWKSYGIELSSWAVAWARKELGLTRLRQGDHHDLQHYKEGSFDVLTSFDVIEHVVDPRTFVAECARVVKPEGYIVLTTPRLDSLFARVMGRYWYCILPAHLHYFTLRSLRRLLEEEGFNVLEVKRHTRYLGARYFWRRLLAFLRIKKFSSAQGVSSRLLLPVNLGDEFEIYAQKKGV